jgi:REP element-mobilizing transposase RayT
MEFLDPKPPPRLAGRYDRGYLPHLRAQGRSYYVTFRLEGTLPQDVLRQFQVEREALLAKAKAAGGVSRLSGAETATDGPAGKPAIRPAGKPTLRPVGKPALRNADFPVGEGLSPEDHQRLFDLYSERIEAYLDAGRGDCWLKDPRIGELIAGALRFFDGQRYELGPWVVMPNHVHAIVRPLGTHLLDEVVKSWKGFTAREANKLLGRAGGPFWAREYYDHLIRDDAERARLADYIHDNPVKAGLCARWEDWPWSSAHRR